MWNAFLYLFAVDIVVGDLASADTWPVDNLHPMIPHGLSCKTQRNRLCCSMISNVAFVVCGFAVTVLQSHHCDANTVVPYNLKHCTKVTEYAANRGDKRAQYNLGFCLWQAYTAANELSAQEADRSNLVADARVWLTRYCSTFLLRNKHCILVCKANLI